MSSQYRKNYIFIVLTALLLAVAPLGAQTFTAQINSFWNLLRTGSLTFTNISVTGGSITGVTLTGSGVFTTLTVSGTSTLATVNTSGLETLTQTGLGTTSTDGWILQNTTAATAGTTVQISPRSKWCGTAWNSGGSVSETDCWVIENLPATVAGTTTSTLKFGSSIAGGVVTYPMILTNAGALTILGTITGVGIATSATSSITWSSRTNINSPSDGQINVFNNANTAGIGLDATTDGTIKIRNRAQNADGSLTAGTAQFNGSVTGSGGGSLSVGGLSSTQNVNVSTGFNYFILGRAGWTSPSDGVAQFFNNAQSGFTRLVLGTNDATTNGSSWNLNAGVLEAKTGDATGFTGIKGSTINATTALQVNGVSVNPPTVLTNTAPYAAIVSTNTETFFGIGSDGLIPAGAINSAKHRISIELAGIYGTNGVTDTINIKFKLCTVSGCGSGTVVQVAATGVVTPGAAVSNQGWNSRLMCNVFTAGASGTVDCQGQPGSVLFTALTTSIIDDIVNTTTSTVDTTVNEYVSVSVTWNNNSANNTITLRNFGVLVY
jgi:hypothetical protein